MIDMTIEKADYMARVFVNGIRDAKVRKDSDLYGKKIIDSGKWSVHFIGHPWVKRAEAEGFGRDLRQMCVHAARARILARADYSNVADLMPSEAEIDVMSANAKRYALAAEWRAQICADYGDVDTYLSKGKRLSAADRKFKARTPERLASQAVQSIAKAMREQPQAIPDPPASKEVETEDNGEWWDR